MLRARMALHLKSLIETLMVASIGEKPQADARLGRLLKMDGIDGDVIDHVERLAMRPDRSRRPFAVGFRDGGVRVVSRKDTNPLELQRRTLTRPTELNSLTEDQCDRP